MGPALNGSSAIRRFEHSDAIKICNGITFDFYTRLPQVIINMILCASITDNYSSISYIYM